MFTVRWKRAALDRLADIWLRAADRKAITAASHQIDLLLSDDPENLGESRPRGRRVLLDAPPLGVIYRVDPATQTVYVLTVWSYA